MILKTGHVLALPTKNGDFFIVLFYVYTLVITLTKFESRDFVFI